MRALDTLAFPKELAHIFLQSASRLGTLEFQGYGGRCHPTPCPKLATQKANVMEHSGLFREPKHTVSVQGLGFATLSPNLVLSPPLISNPHPSNIKYAPYTINDYHIPQSGVLNIGGWGGSISGGQGLVGLGSRTLEPHKGRLSNPSFRFWMVTVTALSGDTVAEPKDMGVPKK